MTPEVVVLPTGTANLASVLAAFRRLGTTPRVAETANDVLSAGHAVLPGVGTFGATMAGLREAGLVDAILARINQDRPVMATCVGLQVLFEVSEESPGAAGLGVLQGDVGHFTREVRVPQFGWNRIEPEAGCRFLEGGFAYFANSYRVQVAPGCRVASAAHGEPFVAAFEHGNLLACQFHAELSGRFGHELIGRWLERTG